MAGNRRKVVGGAIEERSSATRGGSSNVRWTRMKKSAIEAADARLQRLVRIEAKVLILIVELEIKMEGNRRKVSGDEGWQLKHSVDENEEVGYRSCGYPAIATCEDRSEAADQNVSANQREPNLGGVAGDPASAFPLGFVSSSGNLDESVTLPSEFRIRKIFASRQESGCGKGTALDRSRSSTTLKQF